MKKTLIILFLLLNLSHLSILNGQADTSWTVRYDTITRRIRNLESAIPGLNKKITNSVTDVPINEFLRAIAISSGINLSIDPNLDFKVINNFNDVKVSDVLLFLCDEYKLDISSIGSIIIIKQLKKSIIPNTCVVSFDSASKRLSINVEDVDLGILAKKITDATGINVIPDNGLYDQKIKAYIKDMPVAGALDKIAYSNNLDLVTTEDSAYLFEKAIKQPENATKTPPSVMTSSKQPKKGTYKLGIDILGNDSIRIYAERAPISEILKEVSVKSGQDYVISSLPKGEATLQLNGAKYEDILRSILSGTEDVFKKVGRVYIVGNKDSPDLMNQKFIQLQYRSVDSILYIIPRDLISDIEVKIFREQNSIMLSGPVNKVAETEKFIQQIDRLVPVVSIEVMIIDYNESNTISTGITTGLGTDATTPTSGKVFPSLDMTLNSNSINDLINRFNGFGWAKIGKVTPNFYAQIKAMESQGILNIRSTPILSTLNGHETKLSIGKTEYYLEEQYNIIGTQNPQSTKIDTYKPIDAELSVVITPIVSGDDQITLEVEVNQADFTERISTTAPPGKVTRTFKSQIRVKNEEMILLGGLEENRDSKTSSGTPILSKIPILKWIFSGRSDVKSKSKLNIFIKPTIIS